MRVIRLLISAACLAGIVYLHVWQRVQILKLGYEIARMEEKNEQLAKERRLLRLEYSRASSVDRLSGDTRDEFRNSISERTEIVDVLVPQNSTVNGSGE